MATRSRSSPPRGKRGAGVAVAGGARGAAVADARRDGANGGVRAAARRGLSMAEAVVCVALVGGLLVAALNAAGGIRRTQVDGQQRLRAHLLAQELMSEILAQNYLEPAISENFGLDDLGLNLYLLGPDGGESTSNRLQFDDVDDYHGWAGTPPRQRDGTAIAGADGLTRACGVTWVDPANRAPRILLETGLKRITVVVSRGNVELARLDAYKSPGLLGDQPMRVALVIRAPLLGLLWHAQDTARKNLLQSWGYDVAVIYDNAGQDAYNSACADRHVVYVSAQADPGLVGTKLRDAPIGVVNECRGLVDDFGLAPQTAPANRADMIVTGVKHPVTAEWAPGSVAVFTGSQPVYALLGVESTSGQTLGLTSLSGGGGDQPSLVAYGYQAVLQSGGSAAARRVQLPWGQDGVAISNLNANGRALLKRALEWAGGLESP